MELSEKLQELRKEKGLTQEEPADELLSGGEIPKFADEDNEQKEKRTGDFPAWPQVQVNR